MYSYAENQKLKYTYNNISIGIYDFLLVMEVGVGERVFRYVMGGGGLLMTKIQIFDSLPIH